MYRADPKHRLSIPGWQSATFVYTPLLGIAAVGTQRMLPFVRSSFVRGLLGASISDGKVPQYALKEDSIVPVPTS
jgi:hypothetical protein